MWWSSESQGHCQSARHTVKHTHTHTHACSSAGLALHLSVTVAKFVWSSVLRCFGAVSTHATWFPCITETPVWFLRRAWMKIFPFPGMTANMPSMFNQMISCMWAGEFCWGVLAWTPVTWGCELLMLMLMMPSDLSRSPVHLPVSELSIRRWGTITQVAWAHLSPPRPWQEVGRQPSDPPHHQPRWPFLFSCCLTGRKDAVCHPQAPLARSPLLRLTEKPDYWFQVCLSLSLLLFFNPVYISLSPFVTIRFFFPFFGLFSPLPLWEQLNAANHSISVVFGKHLTYF